MAVIVGWPLSIGYSAEIERVEPPNWWVGFQHPVLQLQVYGEDVGTLSPSVDWPGVSIVEVIATGNPNYLFLRLSIGPDTEAGEFDIVFTGADGSIAHAYSLNERNAGVLVSWLFHHGFLPGGPAQGRQRRVG